MTHQAQQSARNRGGSALASLAANLLIAILLLWGLRQQAPEAATNGALEAVITFEPPPPSAPAAEAITPDRSEAAPEGALSEAAPVEAPPVAVPLAPPIAVPTAGAGQASNAGAGDAGSGIGAGGTGDGAGGGIATPARRIAGALDDRDYPRTAARANLAGTVAISFRVRTDGRVDQCTVDTSSGHAVLDDLTCQLLTQRFRFEPARTASGRAVASTLRTSFTWGTRRR